MNDMRNLMNKMDNAESSEPSVATEEKSVMPWFKKMVVVSSKDDNFVPYYSSRIDANPSQYTSDERIIRMSENMLKRLKKIERM